MKIITINKDNIAGEHICCAISDKKGETCDCLLTASMPRKHMSIVDIKKAWLIERFSDGLVFKKLDARGKVFIEYIPAEKAWTPIIADNYMFIDCFWVSGQFKGQGYGNALLEECIADAKAKGKIGLVILSSKKKMPFLSDPQYLKYKGFQVADSAEPYYELLYLPFLDTAPKPAFKDCAKKGKIEEKGMVLFYTNQCPHTEKYAPPLKEWAGKRGATIKLVKIETTEQAQKAPTPFTTYSFFYDGKFVTNEIFPEKKFNKFLDSVGV